MIFIIRFTHTRVIITFIYSLLNLIREFFISAESKETIAVYVTHEFGTKTSCI